MPEMNNSQNVKKQYSNDNNLATRLKLHAKHSTNKLGIVPWLFQNYKFTEGIRILELGCGNGNQWEGRINSLPENCLLVLSDLSDGMVQTVWEKYSSHKNVLAQKIDVQEIPYPNNSFDIIIANHMLYHIPDLAKALSEISRVLSTDGTFYAATNGNGGLRPYLNHAVKSINPEIDAFSENFTFNLLNGKELLSNYFSRVSKVDYNDSLSITETQDLIDWITSTISNSKFSKKDIEALYFYFEKIRKEEGAINIPKESGLFISLK